MDHKTPTILGAIAGDIIGSVYEFNQIKTTDFNLFDIECDFTDDTVMTIAIADCILHYKDFALTMHEYGREYPNRGYGGNFLKWIFSNQPKPYNSFGNGSAMRISPVGFAYDQINTVLEVARQSAEVTHNHPEGIKGAQATAAAVFLAYQGKSKKEIKNFIINNFHYDLNFTIDQIRPFYHFNETCQETVPQAIVAFLESTDYESAIRLAISLGGDSDTLACITGGIAAAYYKFIPESIVKFSLDRLPVKFIELIDKFDHKFSKKVHKSLYN